MSEAEPKISLPHPFTPRGIARIAVARSSRLVLIGLLVATFAAGSIVWFIGKAWSPTISAAIREMPEQAKIESGKLAGAESGVMADGKFLSISVELEAHDESGIGDIRVGLFESFFEVCSLLGCFSFGYPKSVVMHLGYSISSPWWGAWQPAILAGVGVGTVLVLFAAWAFFALLYAWPARVLGYFADRDLKFRRAWKLGIAAQFPAALFLALCIILYGSQVFDLAAFLVFYGLHFLIAICYCLLSVYFVPKLDSANSSVNPFRT